MGTRDLGLPSEIQGFVSLAFSQAAEKPIGKRQLREVATSFDGMGGV